MAFGGSSGHGPGAPGAGGGSRGGFGGGGFSVDNSNAPSSGFSGAGSFGAPSSDGGIGGFSGTGSFGRSGSFGRGGGRGGGSRETISGSRLAAGSFSRNTSVSGFSAGGSGSDTARGSRSRARASARDLSSSKTSASPSTQMSSAVAPSSHPVARGDVQPSGFQSADERAAAGSTTATAMRDAILADARKDNLVTSALKSAPVIGPAVRAMDVVAESINAANRINSLEGVPSVSATDIGAQLATEEAAGMAMGLIGGEIAGRVAGGIASNFSNSPVTKGMASVAGKLGGSALGRSFGRSQAAAYGPMGSERLAGRHSAATSEIAKASPNALSGRGGGDDAPLLSTQTQSIPSLYRPQGALPGHSFLTPVTFSNYSSYAKAVFA